MLNKKLTIRQASSNDANLIADIGVRTFEASFGALNRPEDMKQYMFQSFSITQIKAQLADPSIIFFLARVDNNVIGYVMLRSGKKPDFVTGNKPIEIGRFYLEKEFIGKGYGSALINLCLEFAKKNGYDVIFLGVWEKNLHAIRFYEKCGFTKFGARELFLGKDLQNDHIMAISV